MAPADVSLEVGKSGSLLPKPCFKLATAVAVDEGQWAVDDGILVLNAPAPARLKPAHLPEHSLGKWTFGGQADITFFTCTNTVTRFSVIKDKVLL